MYWILFNKIMICQKNRSVQKKLKKNEAQGPQLAHLSETATADMQMACNIFPILSNIETYGKAMA